MIEAVIIWLASVLVDSSHCARWTTSRGRQVCADVRLDAPTCFTAGWHQFAQGITVCSTACGAEGPTS